YYDAFEDAAVKAIWTQESTTPPPTTCTAGQFQAQYFNSINLNGTAALTQCESAPINHDWQLGSPAPGISSDLFSARYTGNFDFAQGQYRFDATADDGVRIYVDGQLILNGWVDQA